MKAITLPVSFTYDNGFGSNIPVKATVNLIKYDTEDHDLVTDEGIFLNDQADVVELDAETDHGGELSFKTQEIVVEKAIEIAWDTFDAMVERDALMAAQEANHHKWARQRGGYSMKGDE